MALRINPLPLNTLPQPARLHFFPLSPSHRSFSVPCTSKKKASDAEIASALAEEVSRDHAQRKQRDQALSKSRAIRFSELCGSASLAEDEMRDRWGRIGEGERLGLVRQLVSNWSSDFNPLSARSAKEMIEEHLEEAAEALKAMEKTKEESARTSSSLRSLSYDRSLFPRLRKM